MLLLLATLLVVAQAAKPTLYDEDMHGFRLTSSNIAHVRKARDFGNSLKRASKVLFPCEIKGKVDHETFRKNERDVFLFEADSDFRVELHNTDLNLVGFKVLESESYNLGTEATKKLCPFDFKKICYSKGRYFVKVYHKEVRDNSKGLVQYLNHRMKLAMHDVSYVLKIVPDGPKQ
jgi:hypothetical protein